MDKTMYVTLVVGADPEVQVDPVVLGKTKMRWRKDEDSVDFDFVSIAGLPPDSFTVTKSTDSKINVTDLMVAGDYPYTITVEYNGAQHTTTKSGPPAEGGKPVIRN